MPGQPGPSTTVIVPAGAFTAPSLRTAWRAASSANRRPRVDRMLRCVGGGGVARCRAATGSARGPRAGVAGVFFLPPFRDLLFLIPRCRAVIVVAVAPAEEL